MCLLEPFSIKTRPLTKPGMNDISTFLKIFNDTLQTAGNGILLKMQTVIAVCVIRFYSSVCEYLNLNKIVTVPIAVTVFGC